MRDRRGFTKRGILAYLGWFGAFVLLIYIFLYMPTPFVVFQPGSAESVRPMVDAPAGYHDEQGTLMLTTVSSSYPNVALYVRALLDPNAQILRKSDLLQQGETTDEYYYREKFMMRNSQSNAIQAAYRALGVPFQVKPDGVMITSTEDTPAGHALAPGDEIAALDGKPMSDRDAMLAYLADKKVGDKVRVTFLRNKEKMTATVPLVDLNALDSTDAAADQAGREGKDGNAGKPKTPHPGLGVVPQTLLEIEPNDPDQRVDVKVGNIIGPSAGMMIALEIYNQLTSDDVTKGYRIAGTGEIDPEGNVGVIGGIEHKVVAADREHADIFFAPADYEFPGNAHPPIRNYSAAVEKAKQIHTKMKIVKVTKLGDALAYLKSLPPKPASSGKAGG